MDIAFERGVTFFETADFDAGQMRFSRQLLIM
jgi:hypothetical protein